MTPLQTLIFWIARHDNDVINQQYISGKAAELLEREREIMVDFALRFSEFADRETVEHIYDSLFNVKKPQ